MENETKPFSKWLHMKDKHTHTRTTLNLLKVLQSRTADDTTPENRKGEKREKVQ